MNFFIGRGNHCGKKFPWVRSYCRNGRRTNLIFMRIRLIFTILIVSIGFVTADAAHAQNISLSVKNAPLKDVLAEIEKQSGYEVFYNNKHFENSKTVTLAIARKGLKEVLNACFKSQPLYYEIVGKTIVIKPKSASPVQKAKNITSKLIDIKGTVTDESDRPLFGATIKVKDSNKTTTTDNEGKFMLSEVDQDAVLVISYVGYQSAEIRPDDTVKVRLHLASSDLEEVSVVSTGYQEVPKERATGSFTIIDSKTINRSVGVNILDRLDGVTSGLLLNRGLEKAANNSVISVRGRSTIFANAAPLIVLDGFPYEGTIEQINPMDIENITILKDAAAASIWGTRASNGVIVLKSKMGRKKQQLAINLSSTLTISEKPDLYYAPQISSADYIDLEQYLFNKGYFNGSINLKYSAISRAVEVMNRKKMGLITAADSISQINELKGNDIRSDLLKYAYRPKVHQQYQINLSGGNDISSFYISGGYDKNLESSVTNDYERLSFNAKNSVSLIGGRLELFSDLNFNSSTTNSKSNAYIPYSPYDRLADEKGNSLATVNNLRITYLDTAGNGKLLDWHYRPKDELQPNRENRITQYRLNFGLAYKIADGLTLSAKYQFLNEDVRNDRDALLTEYLVRNTINTYSSINGNSITYGIPLGNILDQSLSLLKTKTARFQVNYFKVFAQDHEINAIGGYENTDGRKTSSNQVIYGYNPETRTNGNNLINPMMPYRYYYSRASTRFSTAPNSRGMINFTQSYYANISYAYKGRYMFSGSARKDESNLFGVDANQKGVPLWSTGLSWNIDKEAFYKLEWLPQLKLRATYGYNGNIDKTLSGYLTIQSLGFTNFWDSPYASIVNPPNPALTWEKVRTWNLGLDYAFKNNRVMGSIDVYQKNATDLIGNGPISMQTGVAQFKGNVADLQGKGIDFVITSRNIDGKFNWTTSFLLNYNIDKVTGYKIRQSSNYNIVSGNYNNPLQGYPYYAIFSFPSAGLDAEGNPQGFVEGVASKDYSSIINALDPSRLKYHGSGSPKYFGGIINSFAYKNFELSVNILYKFDYFFRRTSIFSGSNYLFRVADYDNRWKKAGDESLTDIPSLVYPSDTFRDTFFQYSEKTVEKGDNIRLQDIRLSYQLPLESASPLKIKKLGVFIYSQNLGILWSANKRNIDPDYGSGSSSIPQPLSCSLGLNLSF